MPGPPDAQQRPGFVDLHITHGAVLVGLQVAHDAGFADLGVGGGERKESQSPLRDPGPAPDGLCSDSGIPSSPPCPRSSAHSKAQRGPGLTPPPSLGEEGPWECVRAGVRPVSCTKQKGSPKSDGVQNNSPPAGHLPGSWTSATKPSVHVGGHVHLQGLQLQPEDGGGNRGVR